jgi:hypothetical protein
MVAAVTTVEFVTVFRLTNVFVATVTSVRRVALAARYSIYTEKERGEKGLEKKLEYL